MRVKLVEMDIRNVEGVNELAGYESVEILVKDGRNPIGRKRIVCEADFLTQEQICSFLKNFETTVLSKPSGGSLPTVTVAICTRNRIGELSGALRSLTRQEYPADEILIIDNGCQKEVQALVEKIDPDALYVRERRPGLNFARNRAISEANGEVIAFLDDDAEADIYWVQSLAECFAEFLNAGSVTGLILPFELETEAQVLFEANCSYYCGFSRRVLPRDKSYRLGIKLPMVAEAISIGSGCNMAFRTEVLKKLNGFDVALDIGPPLPGGGDLDMFYRVMRTGHELVYEPRAMVRHRHRRLECELRKQLAGHYRALTAFLVKSLLISRGRERFEVFAFLVWRILKTGFRLIRRIEYKEPLPINMISSMLVNAILGLGSYHAVSQRGGVTRRTTNSKKRATGP